MGNTEKERLCEKKLSSSDIYNGNILCLKRDTVSLPNGNKALREVVRHIGAVCIVPVTKDGRVVVERQYRYPIDKVITEIPAGKLDFPEEDRLEAAKRELKEETGITAQKWTDIGIYYPAAAYSDEKITMYLATELEFGERNPDEDEFLDIITVDMDELIKDIVSGKIQDGKTQAAIMKAKYFIENSQSYPHGEIG